MYPSYGGSVLGVGTVCRFILAVSEAVVMVRTFAAEAAYRTLQGILNDFYLSEPSFVWQLSRADAVVGAACVVFRNSYALRGEIVSIDDDDGECFEIYFVDDGDTAFFSLHHLRSPHPLALALPALAVECTVHGLDLPNISISTAALEDIGRQNPFIVHDIIPAVGDEPPSVRFVTIDNVDIARLVIGPLGGNPGDDEGFGYELLSDEAFSDDNEEEEEEEDQRIVQFIPYSVPDSDDEPVVNVPLTCDKAEESESSSSDDEELDDNLVGLFIVDRE